MLACFPHIYLSQLLTHCRLIREKTHMHLNNPVGAVPWCKRIISFRGGSFAELVRMNAIIFASLSCDRIASSNFFFSLIPIFATITSCLTLYTQPGAHHTHATHSIGHCMLFDEMIDHIMQHACMHGLVKARTDTIQKKEKEKTKTNISYYIDMILVSFSRLWEIRPQPSLVGLHWNQRWFDWLTGHSDGKIFCLFFFIFSLFFLIWTPYLFEDLHYLPLLFIYLSFFFSLVPYSFIFVRKEQKAICDVIYFHVRPRQIRILYWTLVRSRGAWLFLTARSIDFLIWYLALNIYFVV